MIDLCNKFCINLATYAKIITKLNKEFCTYFNENTITSPNKSISHTIVSTNVKSPLKRTQWKFISYYSLKKETQRGKRLQITCKRCDFNNDDWKPTGTVRGHNNCKTTSNHIFSSTLRTPHGWTGTSDGT